MRGEIYKEEFRDTPKIPFLLHTKIGWMCAEKPT
jgi:hypothetical protein